MIGPAAAAQEMLYAQAEAAFRQGAALLSAGPDLRFLPLTECNLAQIDHALVRIAQAATPWGSRARWIDPYPNWSFGMEWATFRPSLSHPT